MLVHYFVLFFCVSASVTANTSNASLQSRITNEEAPVTETNYTFVDTCSDSEWRCADGGCIRKEERCNAAANCRDASDEFLDICGGVERPAFRLQMLCFSLAGTTKQICPQICYDQPEFCYYALLAENGQRNTCRFPKYPEHGKYTVQPLVGRPVAEGFRLDYTCDQSHALVQSKPLECVNGSWLNGDEHRYCAETCQLPKANFTYTCQDAPCNDQVPVGSEVTVTRKGTEDVPIAINMVCQKNLDYSFNISLDCVTDVDRLQQEFESPTMQKMIEFESKFNQFKSKEISSDFQKLVEEFHTFEHIVRENLNVMHIKSEECDLYLDLLMYNLKRKNLSALAEA